MERWKEGQEVFLLLTKEQVECAMEAWVKGNWACDLTICKSRKRAGRYVLRTHHVVWASYIIKWYGFEQVVYK